MDVFKFQEYLFDTLEPNYSSNEMNLAHDAVCQMLRHTNSPPHTALLLIRTGYAMMIAARGVKGVEQFCYMMEQEAKTLQKAKNYIDLKARTREIETSNQD